MMDDGNRYQAPETDLVLEVDRLRGLLKRAGIDAQQSLREAEEAEIDERRRVHDVTEERARTQAARVEVEEMRHRLKNTFSVVRAIANATLRPAQATFDSRLDALAQAHDILFQSNWGKTSLRTIIDGILAPYVGRGPNRFRANGPEVSLSAKPARAFELAIHELGTNAAKYGALPNDDG